MFYILAYSKENETWTGKWFPAKPDFLNDNFRSAEKNITIEVTPQVDDVEISSSFCDDGQVNQSHSHSYSVYTYIPVL